MSEFGPIILDLESILTDEVMQQSTCISSISSLSLFTWSCKFEWESRYKNKIVSSSAKKFDLFHET